MPDDMIEKMLAAVDLMKTADDNLLKAIASIAYSGHINVVPMPTILSTEPKPVIMLPERMYNRMLDLFGPEATQGASQAAESSGPISRPKSD
jgi:hypothetical protein